MASSLVQIIGWVLWPTLAGAMLATPLLIPYLVVRSSQRKTRQAAEPARSWERTSGQVVRSELEWVTHVMTLDRTPLVEAQVLYRYVVSGREYRNNRVTFGDVGTNTPGPQQAVLDRYPVNRTVTVYFDPNQPEYSVLEFGSSSGHSWAERMLLVMAGLAFVGGAVLTLTFFVMVP